MHTPNTIHFIRNIQIKGCTSNILEWLPIGGGEGVKNENKKINK